MSYLFWLGASADADRVLSPSATEPVVSAHSGSAPSRGCEHSWQPVYYYDNHYPDWHECSKCGEHE